MSEKVKCPTCGKLLKVINRNHIDSKKHQNALKKKGLSETNDPVLKFISKKSTRRQKSSSKMTLNKLIERVDKIEFLIRDLKNNQDLIFKSLEKIGGSDSEIFMKKSQQLRKKIAKEDIKNAIAKCIQNNNNRSLWVKIDDVISILRLNREEDRDYFNRILVKMFNHNMIDLAEGGDPKNPVIYRNRQYGMITLQ
ncbi:MAG: hypothetical protein P8Y97_06875 [Candidatus Lokiarchaeota archaeon]